MNGLLLLFYPNASQMKKKIYQNTFTMLWKHISLFSLYVLKVLLLRKHQCHTFQERGGGGGHGIFLMFHYNVSIHFTLEIEITFCKYFLLLHHQVMWVSRGICKPTPRSVSCLFPDRVDMNLIEWLLKFVTFTRFRWILV